MADAPGREELRLAELVAALSNATDLGTGHPLERALRACLFAVAVGDALGCGAEALADIYYVTLLRFAGCAADARHRAALFGDEIALGPEIDMVELWKVEPMVEFLRLHGFGRLPPGELQALLATGVQRSVDAAAANCEVGQSIARRLGLGPGVVLALGDVFERWDGGGVPGRAAGDRIALAARVAAFALDCELFYRAGGLPAALRLAAERSGGQYDPELAALLRERPALAGHLDAPDPWEAVLAAEPGPPRLLRGPQVDEAVRAIADFNDLRTPFLSGHSSAVADLCARAAATLGLPERDAAALRRAAWIHDVGSAAVSVSIWEKPGPLSAAERERVRLHPYYTERITARSPALRPVGQLAAAHHERPDGAGYHRQIPSAMLPPAAHILAAAEVYRGMVEPRPHRPAHPPERAAEELRALARSGGLEPAAAEATLAAAGHRAAPARSARPAGLTAREVEVLQLIAAGRTNRQIAQALTVAPATVDHHVRHIFDKVGCSTRLAATMFAMEHRLLPDRPAREP